MAVIRRRVPAVAGAVPDAGRPRCEQAEFRFKNKLISMDASVIDLCATVFDWARYRKSKGAVKLHLLLDHDGHLPAMR